MRCFRRTSALVGVAIAFSIGYPADSTASLDPYAIFARARQYFEAQRYPAYIDYDVAVRVVEGGKERAERYASSYDATDGYIAVDPVSDYELEHPATGKGVNVGLLFAKSKPETPVDFLGVPRLTPAYSFGIAKFVPAPPPHAPTDAELVAEVRAAFHDPNPRATATPMPRASADDLNGLREIAAVTVYKRDYRITLVGEETISGHACYHLALQPLRTRDRDLRLRDVWVDEATYATERLREAWNFSNGPGTSVPWTVDFTDTAGVHYVASERAEVPMSYRGLVYTQAFVSFEHIRPRDNPPGRRLTPLTNGIIMEEPST